jgi:PAS domain S-box-containing protein
MSENQIFRLLKDLSADKQEARKFILKIGKKILECDEQTGILITQRGRLLYANDNFCTLLNINRDEIINSNTYEWVPETDRPMLMSCVEKLYNEGSLEHLQRVMAKNGQYVWFKISSLYSTRDDFTVSFLEEIKKHCHSELPIHNS